ncbi:MAG: T9SS type A sorting domain-containing protein [candidate division WOR-3 bacterium]|nr:MAG: T9SS type A sorting domain-containing protein [candidate division WOR-3 bacterium]
MLDTIAMIDYPEQTALVEYHSVDGDFGYLQEADNRIYNNFYVFMGYPSLFADGSDLWPISTWRPWLTSRMSVPSPIALNISGDYDPVTNNGTVTASFYNESTSAITARVYFVITEDSLYHADPNGHAWHNKLARDFLPTEIGEEVTINPAENVDVSRLFTIDPGWDENRCNIVTWIQEDPPSRDGLQAGKTRVMDLVGIDEIIVHDAMRPAVALMSNPCSADNIRFAIELPQGTEYRIDIFDVLGRNVHTYIATSSSDRDIAQFNLNQNDNRRAAAGVYLYRFTSQSLNSTGKIIVK